MIQIQMTKTTASTELLFLRSDHSYFDLVSDFDIRISFRTKAAQGVSNEGE